VHDSPEVSWMDFQACLLSRLVSALDAGAVASIPDPAVLRLEVRLVVERLLDEENPLFNLAEREMTIQAVVADALGFGPLERLFDDDCVQEIRVDGPDKVLVRRAADFEPSEVPFRDADQLWLITARLLGHDGSGCVGQVVEREVPANFRLTATFGATPDEPPALHFLRLRPNVPPVVIPPPRLPPRELRAFVRFVKACHAAGVADLLAADDATLRPLAERAVDDFLGEGGHAAEGERERMVAALLNEARQP